MTSRRSLDELAARVEAGWVPFGWHHSHGYTVPLEFDGMRTDGDGFAPAWERLEWPQPRRACGRCKRTIRPDEPAETALLGTVTDDAKHWTVEMLVCGDCDGDS